MGYRERILEEYEGKTLWFCEISGTNGQRINLDPYAITFCHEHEIARPSELTISDVKSFSIDKYYQAVYQLLREMQKDNYPCRKCSNCKKKKFTLYPISGLVTMSTSMYCDNSCIYCVGHFGAKDAGYDPFPLLKPFVEQGMFGKKALFDWGGGEPTQNPFYERTVEYLAGHGFRQRFNTNAIEFSQSTYHALESGLGIARISVDSGTREGYLRVKGTDNFEKVWNNIKKYCEVSDNVFIKYNVCNYNSDLDEIDSFLINCSKVGVKHIIISAEARSYQPVKNAGPFYYREKEFQAAKYLQQGAQKSGFDVAISEYPYESRAVYKDGKLDLPEKYFDNIDRSIITNNIYLTTFANIDNLVAHIRLQRREVYVFGAGQDGRKIGNVLKMFHIPYEFIDNDENLHNTYIDEHLCTSARTCFLRQPEAQIIMAGKYWKEMLKQINEAKYELNGYLYWMQQIYYDDYLIQSGISI
jgi:hypothetical protein